jgi:ring-1,2-phenylacetyl-CoA epoxidase subunit PaaE
VLLSAGETVLDGVLRARIDAPFACRTGVCGTCRARLVDGRVQMAQHFALSDAEVAAGKLLTCQARPTTDVVELDFER